MHVQLGILCLVNNFSERAAGVFQLKHYRTFKKQIMQNYTKLCREFLLSNYMYHTITHFNMTIDSTICYRSGVPLKHQTNPITITISLNPLQ